MLEINKIYNEDCLIGMQKIADKSIDCIVCDLPYGITNCKWDVIIPFDKLWEQYNRIIKDNGAIVLFGSQPFTSQLVCSNLKMFKCEWIYQKSSGSNFANVKHQPMKEHENILVFSRGTTKYNPQMQERSELGKERASRIFNDHDIKCKHLGANFNLKRKQWLNELRYPSSVQKYNNIKYDNIGLHPTQKPPKLVEYLIKTYSNENDLVLDNCMGSGTTAIACLNTNRNFIGFELDKEYFDIAQKRIQDRLNAPSFFDDLIIEEQPKIQTTLFE